MISVKSTNVQFYHVLLPGHEQEPRLRAAVPRPATEVRVATSASSGRRRHQPGDADGLRGDGVVEERQDHREAGAAV